MKKLIVCILATLLVAPLFAQGKVSTRKYRWADFPDKVTQVVLTENEVLSSALRQEVVGGWTASAFEFCTLEQFDRLKTSPDYYFLLAAETRFEGEETPGILFLTLVKGGPEAAEGIGEMDEVLSLPLRAAAGGSGRELIYLGALVQAIQEFALAATESERTAYRKDGWFNDRYNKRGKMHRLFLAREDLAPQADSTVLARYLDPDCFVVDADQADQQFLDGSFNTLVSYSVSPFLPEEGSYCYKMLFLAQTHQLYYIDRHKLSEKKGEGFLPEDLKHLAKKR